MEVLLCVPVLLPLFLGSFICIKKWKKEKRRKSFIMFTVLLNSAMILLLLTQFPDETFTFLTISDSLSLCLRLDGLGSVFGFIAAVAWPLGTLFSIEMLEKDDYRNMYWMSILFSYGAFMGLVFSGNILTMFLFFLILTGIILPLTLRFAAASSKKDTVSSKKEKTEKHRNLNRTLSGAVGFAVSVFPFLGFFQGDEFVFGGVLGNLSGAVKENLLLAAYVLGVFAICLLTRMFPVGGLVSAIKKPQGEVSPSALERLPAAVFALLYGIAAALAGAFAVLRLTYYCFGMSFVRNTWAQVLLLLSLFALMLIYGLMTVRSRKMGRRVRSSGYLCQSHFMMGAALMTPAGLASALLYIILQTAAKFCALLSSSVLFQNTESDREDEVDGIGYRMPVLFLILSIALLSLAAIPPLAGFAAEWSVMDAAFDRGGLALVGAAALTVSVFLTAAATLSMMASAYFPENRKKGVKAAASSKTAEKPGKCVWIPLIILGIMIVAGGFQCGTLVTYLKEIALGGR